MIRRTQQEKLEHARQALAYMERQIHAQQVESKTMVDFDSLRQRHKEIRQEIKMAYQQRPGSGSLFTNRKKTAENQPDYKGTALVQVGDQLVEVEIAAWGKNSEKAGDWYSLSLKATNVRPNEDVSQAFENQ